MTANLAAPGQQEEGEEALGGAEGAPVGAEGSGPPPSEYSGVQVGVEVKTVDQRILMLLSNAGFCRTAVLPQLVHKYQDLWSDGSAPSPSPSFSPLSPSLT